MLKALPAGCIDLTVTSPPYDNLRLYNGFTLDWHEIIKELHRVTKPGGVVVWVVADQTINGSETGTSFKQALWAMECGFNLETMVYEQAGTGAKGSNYYYWQSFEFMFIWAKGKPAASNRIADVKNSQAGKPRGFRAKSAQIGSRVDRPNIIAPEYSVRPNVWRYAVGSNGETEIHEAPFPNALARDHIISWSNPGDLVLDPFIGSGTTANISQEYVELARKRVAWANPPLLVVD